MKSKNLHVVSKATLSPQPPGGLAERPRASWIRAWAPVLAMCAVIFTASSLPASSLPKTLLFSGQDKVEHALVYGLLGLLVARAWQRRRSGRKAGATGAVAAFRLAPLLVAIAFTILFGLSDEFHQSFVPGRSVEGLDLLADTTGGLLGGLLAMCMWSSGRVARLRGDQEPW
jgi:VanZ family protein